MLRHKLYISAAMAALCFVAKDKVEGESPDAGGQNPADPNPEATRVVEETKALLAKAEQERDEALAAGQQAIGELQAKINDLEAQLAAAQQDGGASKTELRDAKAIIDKLRAQVAALEPATPASAARGEKREKAPKGEVWLTANVTVTRTVEPGVPATRDGPGTPPKTEEVPAGKPFTLPEAEARALIDRFGGELLA